MQIRLFDETARLCSAAELFQRTGTGLTVLRTFRLLRILKLVRFLPALRHQLVVMLRTMDNVATFFALLCLFIFIFRFSPTSLSVSVLTDIPYAYRYFFHLDVQIWTSLNLRIFFIQFYTILDNFTYIFWNNTGTEGVILHFDKSIFLSIYFAPPPTSWYWINIIPRPQLAPLKFYRIPNQTKKFESFMSFATSHCQ